jgi:hypothetical protein
MCKKVCTIIRKMAYRSPRMGQTRKRGGEERRIRSIPAPNDGASKNPPG